MMTSPEFINENGILIWKKQWFQLELEYPINAAATLRVKSFLPDNGGEVELSLMGQDLKTISDMLVEAEKLRSDMINDAQNEASVILEMRPPIEYVVSHLSKKHSKAKKYAHCLMNCMLEQLDFQRDMDYEDFEKTLWFETLCKIRDQWSELEVEVSTKSNPMIDEDKYGQDYESASDYWKRVADDSDMSLEEYFNSVD